VDTPRLLVPACIVVTLLTRAWMDRHRERKWRKRQAVFAARVVLRPPYQPPAQTDGAKVFEAAMALVDRRRAGRVPEIAQLLEDLRQRAPNEVPRLPPPDPRA
jgi:hypothetical protein